MSNLVNAYLQAQQLGLQKKQFQMQQAEMGYVPAHTETQQVLATQGKNGQLVTGQPGVVPIDNVPSYVPGAPTGYGGQSGPRAGAVGVTVSGGIPTPGLTGGPAFAQPARAIPGGGPTYVNKPVHVGGYYDLKQSLPYMQSEMNGRLMAAIYGGMYRQNEAEARYGHVDDQGNWVPGSDYRTRMDVQNARTQGALATTAARNQGSLDRVAAMYGSGIDPTTGEPIGALTESRLTTQAPALQERMAAAGLSASARAAALAERARHNQVTESQGADRLAITRSTAAARAAQLQKYGVLAPQEVKAWTAAYNSAKYNFKTPEQAETEANAAVAALRNAAGKDSLPTVAPKPDTTTSQPSLIQRLFHSGTSTAPQVPRSGAEASGLPHSRAPQGGAAPTTRLGNRAVGDSSTGSYPRASNLPGNPSAATVPGAGAGALTPEQIEAFYQQALARGVDPTAARARRDSLLAQIK